MKEESGLRFLMKRWIGVVGVACLVAIVSLWYRNSLLPAYRNGQMALAEWTFIAAISVALIELSRVPSVRLPISRFLSRRFLLILVPVLLFVEVYRLAMFQFGGSDEGMLAHVAVYYANGFKPYIDFPSSVPPFFMAGVRAAVLALGLKWANFALLSAGFCATSSLWAFAVLRYARLPYQWAIALTLVIELCTLFVAPFWWYNNLSSVAAVLLLVSSFACLQSQDRWFPWVSLSFALALVLTSKPNVMPICSMVVVLFAGLPRSKWIRTALAGVAALAIAFLICRFAQTPLTALLAAYDEVRKLRGNPISSYGMKQGDTLENLVQIGLLSICSVFFVVILVRSLARGRQSWARAALCLIAALNSGLMALMNAEIKVTDLILMIVAAALLVLGTADHDNSMVAAKENLAGLMIVFGTISGFFGMTHLRILAIGEGSFYEPLPTTTIRGGFFSGLEAAPHLEKVIQETGIALSAYPSRTVFFGPRMEFEYAVFEKKPMSGMPMFWDAGDMFVSTRLPGMISAFKAQDPALLVFLKHDFSGMSILADFVRNSPQYQRIDGFETLTVFVRKHNNPPQFSARIAVSRVN